MLNLIRSLLPGLLMLHLAGSQAGVVYSQDRDSQPLEVDILLKGGTILDGSGQPGFVGDVALKGDRIVGVGSFQLASVIQVIDCSGLYITPGYIDLHSHSDHVVTDPLLRSGLNYLLQGCTTQVTGNCGSGPVDVGKLYRQLDEAGTGTNIAHLVPQGGVRSQVIGSENRAATADELQQMRALVEQGMRDGAWGLSTGLIYVPSVYASTEEIASLAEIAGAHGGIYASHIRGEGDGLLTAVKEAIEIGRRSKAPAHISHFKSSGEENWGKLRLAIELVESARNEGLTVTADQYPYTASSTSLEATILPTWARAGGHKAMLARFDDAETGPRLQAAIAEELKTKRNGAALFIARYAPTPRWVGKNLAEIAQLEQRDVQDVALEMLRNGNVSIVNFSMDENDVREAMQKPWVATASDGRNYYPDGSKPHPRSYGTFPRKIGRYALRDGVLPVEQAVFSASGLPAKILNLPERGLLQTGFFADVVVFAPQEFLDAATFSEPHQYTIGTRYVFVNGVPAVYAGEPTGTLSGRALRHAKP